MDTMNFLVGVVIIMLAASYDAYWLSLAVGVLMILTMRGWGTLILVVASLVLIFVFQGSIKENALYLIFGLVILSLALSRDNKQPDPYGGMGGGMEGLGGLMGAPPGY